MKLLFIYSYDGSEFCGSQRQPHENSVENYLQKALCHVGIFDKVVSSSRTDKGVHALNQCSSVFCKNDYFNDKKRLCELINRHLHPKMHIKKIMLVDDNFNVRFDAIARGYRYVINHSKFSPFLSKYCHFMPKFDIEKLNDILQVFVGEHDFKNYMKAGSSAKSSVRTVYFARAFRKDNLSIITFKANGFLRSQIRLMLSNSFKALNDGKMIENSYKLQAYTRIPFSPNGLYLNKIFYNNF